MNLFRITQVHIVLITNDFKVIFRYTVIVVSKLIKLFLRKISKAALN